MPTTEAEDFDGAFWRNSPTAGHFLKVHSVESFVQCSSWNLPVNIFRSIDILPTKECRSFNYKQGLAVLMPSACSHFTMTSTALCLMSATVRAVLDSAFLKVICFKAPSCASWPCWYQTRHPSSFGLFRFYSLAASLTAEPTRRSEMSSPCASSFAWGSAASKASIALSLVQL